MRKRDLVTDIEMGRGAGRAFAKGYSRKIGPELSVAKPPPSMSVVGVPPQPVDATQALNLSAGVSNCKVSRGRSFSWRATLFRQACECGVTGKSCCTIVVKCRWIGR